MGLPVVATDIRGGRQVVEPEATGLLVPARDATRLAEAIAALVSQPETRRRMGQAAIGRAKAEFDQARVIRKTLDVYDSLLKASRGGISTG